MSTLCTGPSPNVPLSNPNWASNSCISQLEFAIAASISFFGAQNKLPLSLSGLPKLLAPSANCLGIITH